MVKYLLNAVDTYRVATVSDVEKLHEELLNDDKFQLVEFSYKTKEIKVKGEVVDEYQVVKAKKIFNDEKEPDYSVDVFYGRKSDLLQEWKNDFDVATAGMGEMF